MNFSHLSRRGFLAASAFAPVALNAAAAAAPQNLRAISRAIEVNGRSAKVFGLIGPDGRPGLTLDANQNFDVALTNQTSEPTLIHWHGLTPPWPQDGVPDNPAPLLAPGETRLYDFPVGPAGTHWMHAHTLQEQNLLAAPLVVRDPSSGEQEIVVLLHDFSFTPAAELLANLQKPGGHMMHDMGAMHDDHASDPDAARQTMAQMMRSGAMVHANDLAFDAFLANDRTLDDPEIFRVDKGATLRLRLINGATATAFMVDVGALDAELIAVDGRDIAAVAGQKFPVFMGQRLDLRLRIPREGGAFPILAAVEGLAAATGVILATSDAKIAKIAAPTEKTGLIDAFAFEKLLSAGKSLAARPAQQQFQVELSGGMNGYDWAMTSNAPLRVTSGERVEITIRNMTMMTHPMHMHGHAFQIVALNGAKLAGALRDTVAVPHMGEAVVAFDAGSPGKWPFHCHHLYHMAAGMMDYVEVTA